MKQRAVIKFHAKFGKNASETFWLMQQVYGDDCLSRANVFLWQKHFLEGRERLEDDSREGKPISARRPEMIEKQRNYPQRIHSNWPNNYWRILSRSFEASDGQNPSYSTRIS